MTITLVTYSPCRAEKNRSPVAHDHSQPISSCTHFTARHQQYPSVILLILSLGIYLVFPISCFYRNASKKKEVFNNKFLLHLADTREHKSGNGQDCVLHLQSFYWAEECNFVTQLTLLLYQLPLPCTRSSPISTPEFSRKMKISFMPLCLPNAIQFFPIHCTGKVVEQQTDNAVIWGKFQAQKYKC